MPDVLRSGLDTLGMIEDLVAEKQIRKGVHPTHPLAIYNYSHHVQFRGTWSDVLMQCRGLVMDTETGEIVARPMRKFFNYSEKLHDEATLRFEDCDAMAKADGSLGIYFMYKGEWVFASRGSFRSRQASVGREIISESEWRSQLNPQYTYLFEIIYPANRIVVQYGQLRHLILLAMVRTESGYDLPHAVVLYEAKRLNIPFPVSFLACETFQALQARNVANQEGYVLRSRTTGERVKVKFPGYIEMHAIRTQFSLKYIRKWFLQAYNGECQDPIDVLESRSQYIPDEYYSAALAEWNRFKAIQSSAESAFREQLQPCLQLAYRDVPNSPMKQWICKYLRLTRTNQPGADQVAREYAMHAVKEAPEPIDVVMKIESEVEGEGGDQGQGEEGNEDKINRGTDRSVGTKYPGNEQFEFWNNREVEEAVKRNDSTSGNRDLVKSPDKAEQKVREAAVELSDSSSAIEVNTPKLEYIHQVEADPSIISDFKYQFEMEAEFRKELEKAELGPTIGTSNEADLQSEPLEEGNTGNATRPPGVQVGGGAKVRGWKRGGLHAPPMTPGRKTG